MCAAASTRDGCRNAGPAWMMSVSRPDARSRTLPKHDALEPDRCAKLLAALATPERLKIIRILASGPRHVSDIAAVLGLPAVNVSHHLKVLEGSGLVEGKKQGRFVRYSFCEGILERVPALAEEECSEAINLGCCKILVPLEAVERKRVAARTKRGGPARDV